MPPRKTTSRKVRVLYPCSVCNGESNKTTTIQCDKCLLWVHASCIPMTDAQHTAWGEAKLEFLCPKCISQHEGGNFSFAMSLGRMIEAETVGEAYLKTRSSIEAALLNQYQPSLPPSTPSSITDIDNVSVKILQQYQPRLLMDYQPRRTRADGNCLYRAVSLALYGIETHHQQLRARTWIEIVSNPEWYNVNDYNYCSPLKDDPRIVLADYPSYQKQTPVLGSFSDMNHVLAISAVLRCPIQSFFPPVSDPFVLSPFTRLIRGRGVSATQPKVVLMWTSVSGSVVDINHFVPLLPIKDRNRKANVVIDIVCDEDPLHSKRKHPTRNTSPSVPVSTEYEFTASDIGIIPVPIPSSSEIDITPVSSLSHRSVLSDLPSLETQQPKSRPHEPRVHSTPNSSPIITRSDSSHLSDISVIMNSPPSRKSDLTDLVLADVSGRSSNGDIIMTKTTPPTIPNGMTCLPNENKFMDTETVVDILTKEKPLISKIPLGIKENVYVVIDNNSNIVKRAKMKHSKFEDDCGAWASNGSTKKHYYLVTDRGLVYTDEKEGVLYTRSKKERVPLDPQPDDSQVLLVKRFYICLKRSPGYKKRVTWIEKFPSALKPLYPHCAIVEYCGNFPDRTCVHGNAKKTFNTEYIRTAENVLEEISERVKSLPPREVYGTMALNTSDSNPRDTKQVRNRKYIIEKDQRKNVKQSRKNPADDMQVLLSDIHESEFVQEIIQTKGKPPSVVLYTQDQLQDLRQMCSSKADHPSVIGVDRTFNLGACFVTLLVYRNSNLRRKMTQKVPILLGPAFLHWDGTYQTYQRFFSHLQSRLDSDIVGAEVGGENLVIGSDEEKALTKALRQCFPSASHVLCTRHVKENVRRHLRHEVGTADRRINLVMEDLFGEKGLLSAEDSFNFNLKAMELEEKLALDLPTFNPYFRKIVPTLKKFIFEPAKKERVPLDWTNNACESINHILKLSSNWKALKLPELVEKIHNVVRLQQADIRRAIHGQGNFELAPAASKFRISHVVWSGMSAEKKGEAVKKLVKGPRKKSKTIVSADGQLTIPKTAPTAKKPGQKTRTKRAKTRTSKN